jgi:hypothetical protein
MRAHYNKLIQTEIRQLRRFKEQAEKRSTPEQIVKFEEKIMELEQELEQETPRFLQYVQEQQEMITLQQKNQLDKNVQSQTDRVNQEKLDAFYQKEHQLRREDRILRYQMKKEWEWLCQQDDKLPDYIRTNLQKMPNNKGYIFKGIWYFGLLPSENKNLLVMFERPMGGDKQLIHEIYKNHYHRIYQKNPQGGQNILVSEKKIFHRV